MYALVPEVLSLLAEPLLTFPFLNSSAPSPLGFADGSPAYPSLFLPSLCPEEGSSPDLDARCLLEPGFAFSRLEEASACVSWPEHG